MTDEVVDIHNRRRLPQELYDVYNNFIFSDNNSIFFKMVKRIELFQMVKHLNGDIVECGVFKGSGMALWIKLLHMYTPHDIRKVVGFDFFNSDFVQSIPEQLDREAMQQVFSRCSHDTTMDTLRKQFRSTGVSDTRYDLVQGDVSCTTKEYVHTRPGFRIALLYMDVDLDVPTYDALTALWPRVVEGGVVVFDEYGYAAWSEGNAVDRFVKEHDLHLCKIDLQSPTAYIVK